MTAVDARSGAAGLEWILIGRSLAMQDLRARVAQVAPLHLSVLVLGPTGAGKELVARALHVASERRGAFVAFNVCAIPDPMLEDTLFGHVKGAFTGAVRDARGLLAAANGGTLFLDEIGGLSLASQMKLLRAVDSQRFHPIGTYQDRQSDFRMIAATNDDLMALLRAGQFRPDFLYRLRAAVVRVPALADHLDDIPELVHHFASGSHAAGSPTIDAEAIQLLQQHDWPGNVRELRHVVEYASGTAARRDRITAYDIAAALDQVRSMVADVGVGAGRADIPRSEEGQRLRQELVLILAEHGGDTALAAAHFGVNQRTIYRWLEKFGLPTPKYVRANRSIVVPPNVLRQGANDASVVRE